MPRAPPKSLPPGRSPSSSTTSRDRPVAVSAYLLLGEVPDLRTGIGAGVIFASGILSPAPGCAAAPSRNLDFLARVPKLMARRMWS